MPPVFMAILTVPSDAELRELAARYALGDLRNAKGIEAGTVNTSYVLELAAGRFFLRIYEEQDHSGAAREAKVLTHLSSRGVRTPAPVPDRDGRATTVVAGKPAALFPWVEGEILCQKRVTTEAAEVLGAALARIHLAGHAPDAPLDSGRFGPESLVGRCDRILTSADSEARALAEPLRERVRRFVGERRRDVPTGLIHGDLFRDNVLWEAPVAPGRCTIAALLDFESAHDGPFAYDIAVTILSWAFGSTFDFGIAAAIVRGYRAVRELEPVERDVLYDETVLGAVRFTITRITDDAIRVGKRWQRFVERREAIERLGPAGFREVLGL